MRPLLTQAVSASLCLSNIHIYSHPQPCRPHPVQLCRSNIQQPAAIQTLSRADPSVQYTAARGHSDPIPCNLQPFRPHPVLIRRSNIQQPAAIQTLSRADPSVQHRPGAALLRSAADPKVGIFNICAICDENGALRQMWRIAPNVVHGYLSFRHASFHQIVA